MTTSETRRSDARRNHERVVRAAVEVFAELGLATTVPDVADRAGVGKATVYRNFPSRDDLVAAVITHQLRWFVNMTRSALDNPDAAAAFRELIAAWFDQIVLNRLAHDMLRTRSVTSADPQIADLITAFEQIVTRAQAANALRSDVNTEDLRTLITGCAQRLAETGRQDEDSRLLFRRLILDALRPQHDHAP
ncbi:Transcriptional regulator [Frankia canadensis]|uniref:Transcriptional regulator n=1 Tax=Frankia canadensis TaxID=1836972 RepID=A0A2I2KQ08_9ACTN|nr:TetR/AcrR family transcriptional regulator [Frankia canadensis]SNQ47744.1 Transcriptional regulator [Frankia canadensis]SOU55034.1 Transcriptional regulator [Frankia canadensis]